MRWKAFFYDLNQKKNKDEVDEVDDTQNKRNTYGLKSPNCPAPVADLTSFENELFDLVKKIKFRKNSRQN